MARRKSKKKTPLRLIGYQRVSTDDQNLNLQRDALEGAGVHPDDIYEDKRSGARVDRPGLELAIRATQAPGSLVERPDRYC